MSKITKIPPRLNPATFAPIESAVKRKVAGYARVSTDSEEQKTSYTAQVDYYTKYIKGRDDWEFAGVYTDEGISATSTARRTGFNTMIADALNGKIDLIVTKSVSRFARNTVDSLTTIRKLKEKGVEVYFEKESIYTLDSKGELLLTIMSSLSQEESRSISENVTWGQRKRMADGKISLPYRHFLGYRKGENDIPEIVPEEAEIVKFIYRTFMLGKTAHHIAEELTLKKIPTPAGKEVWSTSTIESILTNEKYRGSALLQKKFTVDFLTKKTKINEGEVAQYYIEESHEAIIPPEEFELVQAEFLRRKRIGRCYNSKSIFTARLVCECCGGFFGSKVWHSTSKYRRVIWQCNHKFTNGEKCTTPHLYEDYIKDKFLVAMNKILANKGEILENCVMMTECFDDMETLQKKIASIESKMETVAERTRQLIARHNAKPMTAEEYYKQYDAIDKEYQALEEKRVPLIQKIEEMKIKRKFILDYAEMLQSQDDVITEFSETLWLKAIDHATICTDGKMIFVFKDGTKITV
jgi:DNA invertase Pin-like site-specific DNA recombinase